MTPRREEAYLWGSGCPGWYPSEPGQVLELYGRASLVPALVGNSTLKPAAASRSLGEHLILTTAGTMTPWCPGVVVVLMRPQSLSSMLIAGFVFMGVVV